jgi:aminoglycoside phosphotransferase (APT) family kinase protein
MRLGSSEVALPDDLLAWMEEVGGGTVRMADRRPGGGRKEAWVVDLERPDGTLRPCFLRYDRSDPARTKDPWTLQREATVYLALQQTAVPVPTVLGVHDRQQAMLTERVEGETWFSRITDAEEREATARDFMVHLAALHALDVSTLDLPAFPRVTTVSDAVRAELDELARVLAERGGEPDPALAFSLRWLYDHIPDDDSRPVLVQGDTGPGNFLYCGGCVTAVLDWELAHLGDPMDDIAWLSLRATQEPFGDFPTRVREYEELSGNHVDHERVRYFRVMAETKLQVMSHRPAQPERTAAGETRDADRESDLGANGGGGGADAGNAFIYGLLHRRLWLEALAEVTGIALTAAEELRPREPEDHDWMYGAVLAQLRDVIVPRTDDALAKARGKGIARLIKYLSRVDLYGPSYSTSELDDLRTLLGGPVDSVAAGRAAVDAAARAGTVAAEAYLAARWRRVARETELARPAMGVLANRHWPALR